MSWLVRVDHITYACAKGTIEKWAWFHIEVEGGRLVTRIDDVDPDNPKSSMKLWCIDYGAFGIALIEGIDRSDKSQATLFVERHGDHSVQHVAYDTSNLDSFMERLQQHGCDVLGEPISKKDGFGILKQLFCKGYSELNPSETQFAEYVQRPRNIKEELEVTFSQKAGKGFYRQIEEATAQGSKATFTNFSAMPFDWQPPEVAPPFSASRAMEDKANEQQEVDRVEVSPLGEGK
ncbi:VOC family protein [Phormidium tenue FACHB-886]|nr:VOC family protein [Phormidium tenue FACHB-886]